MADTIKKVDYYYATVDDKAGEGARVLNALKAGGVNLEALHVFPTGGGKAQMDFLPRDAAKLTAAAGSAGIKLSAKKTAFLIDGADRPGAMAEIMGKLGAAKINITAVDAACSGSGRFGALLWVKAGDVDAAAKALGAK